MTYLFEFCDLCIIFCAFVEFQIFLPLENYSMVFYFEIIMDFALNIDKLNLANLVGKVMDEIMEYQIFFSKV